MDKPTRSQGYGSHRGNQFVESRRTRKKNLEENSEIVELISEKRRDVISEKVRQGARKWKEAMDHKKVAMDNPINSSRSGSSYREWKEKELSMRLSLKNQLRMSISPSRDVSCPLKRAWSEAVRNSPTNQRLLPLVDSVSSTERIDKPYYGNGRKARRAHRDARAIKINKGQRFKDTGPPPLRGRSPAVWWDQQEREEISHRLGRRAPDFFDRMVRWVTYICGKNSGGKNGKEDGSISRESLTRTKMLLSKSQSGLTKSFTDDLKFNLKSLDPESSQTASHSKTTCGGKHLTSSNVNITPMESFYTDSSRLSLFTFTNSIGGRRAVCENKENIRRRIANQTMNHRTFAACDQGSRPGLKDERLQQKLYFHGSLPSHPPLNPLRPPETPEVETLELVSGSHILSSEKKLNSEGDHILSSGDQIRCLPLLPINSRATVQSRGSPGKIRTENQNIKECQNLVGTTNSHPLSPPLRKHCNKFSPASSFCTILNGYSNDNSRLHSTLHSTVHSNPTSRKVSINSRKNSPVSPFLSQKSMTFPPTSRSRSPSNQSGRSNSATLDQINLLSSGFFRGLVTTESSQGNSSFNRNDGSNSRNGVSNGVSSSRNGVSISRNESNVPTQDVNVSSASNGYSIGRSTPEQGNSVASSDGNDGGRLSRESSEVFEIVENCPVHGNCGSNSNTKNRNLKKVSLNTKDSEIDLTAPEYGHLFYGLLNASVTENSKNEKSIIHHMSSIENVSPIENVSSSSSIISPIENMTSTYTSSIRTLDNSHTSHFTQNSNSSAQDCVASLINNLMNVAAPSGRGDSRHRSIHESLGTISPCCRSKRSTKRSTNLFRSKSTSTVQTDHFCREIKVIRVDTRDLTNRAIGFSGLSSGLSNIGNSTESERVSNATTEDGVNGTKGNATSTGVDAHSRPHYTNPSTISNASAVLNGSPMRNASLHGSPMRKASLHGSPMRFASGSLNAVLHGSPKDHLQVPETLRHRPRHGQHVAGQHSTSDFTTEQDIIYRKMHDNPVNDEEFNIPGLPAPPSLPELGFLERNKGQTPGPQQHVYTNKDNISGTAKGQHDTKEARNHLPLSFYNPNCTCRVNQRLKKPRDEHILQEKKMPPARGSSSLGRDGSIAGTRTAREERQEKESMRQITLEKQRTVEAQKNIEKQPTPDQKEQDMIFDRSCDRLENRVIDKEGIEDDLKHKKSLKDESKQSSKPRKKSGDGTTSSNGKTPPPSGTPLSTTKSITGKEKRAFFQKKKVSFSDENVFSRLERERCIENLSKLLTSTIPDPKISRFKKNSCIQSTTKSVTDPSCCSQENILKTKNSSSLSCVWPEARPEKRPEGTTRKTVFSSSFKIPAATSWKEAVTSCSRKEKSSSSNYKKEEKSSSNNYKREEKSSKLSEILPPSIQVPFDTRIPIHDQILVPHGFPVDPQIPVESQTLHRQSSQQMPDFKTRSQTSNMEKTKERSRIRDMKLNRKAKQDEAKAYENINRSQESSQINSRDDQKPGNNGMRYPSLKKPKSSLSPPYYGSSPRLSNGSPAQESSTSNATPNFAACSPTTMENNRGRNGQRRYSKIESDLNESLKESLDDLTIQDRTWTFNPADRTTL